MDSTPSRAGEGLAVASRPLKSRRICNLCGSDRGRVGTRPRLRITAADTVAADTVAAGTVAAAENTAADWHNSWDSESSCRSGHKSRPCKSVEVEAEPAGHMYNQDRRHNRDRKHIP